MVKKITYFSVAASLISASVLSINLGFMQLSVFRIIIIALTLLLILKSFNSSDSGILINNTRNRLSIEVMIIWLLYAILSAIWVKDYSLWIKDVYFLTLGVICIIIFSNTFKTSNDILICFRIIAIMIIVHNLFGWYEIFTGNYLFFNNNQEFYARLKYPVSMFGNTNDFATFLMISIFILYICIANSKYILIKAIYLTTLFSSSLLLFLTNSRANIIGLILAFAAFIMLLLKNNRMRIIIFLLVLLLCFIVIINLDFIIDTVNTAFEKLDLNTDDNSVSIRVNLIKNGAYFLTKTFWMGTGAGNTEFWMSNYGIFNTSGITNMHNWWMEILSEYGVIIFSLYLVFYIGLFKSLYNRYKFSANKTDITISLGILCCLAGYIIGGVSSSSNMDSEWLWTFWAIVIAYQGCNYNIKKNINEININAGKNNFNSYREL